MPSFEAWDIVKFLFPHSDRTVRERRPEWIVGTKGIQECPGFWG